MISLASQAAFVCSDHDPDARALSGGLALRSRRPGLAFRALRSGQSRPIGVAFRPRRAG
jgi:hypothetical protein